MIPAFLVIALRSDDGRETLATVLIGVCGFSDYLDGLAARLTGQFSRLGALLDPLVDRLLVIAASIVILEFELLPVYMTVAVLAREVIMLLLALTALRVGLEIKVNWIGRLAVWPLMLGGFVTFCADTMVAEVLFAIGIAGSYAASYLYVKSMFPAVRAHFAQGLNH